MSSHSSPYGYYPLSPPWPASGSSPSLHGTRYDRAPVMPYVPLPPCDDYVHAHVSPHHGLITPPPSPSRMHPVLCSSHTVVRYDLATDPHTVRMSSSSPQHSFPSWDLASNPSAFVAYIECELTGHVITVHNRSGITCLDLLVQLHRFFEQSISSDEWRHVQGSQRDAMKAAYTRRTGRMYGQSARMKMVDYLLGQSVFKRILPKHSDASGSTWLLQTTR